MKPKARVGMGGIIALLERVSKPGQAPFDLLKLRGFPVQTGASPGFETTSTVFSEVNAFDREVI